MFVPIFFFFFPFFSLYVSHSAGLGELLPKRFDLYYYLVSTNWEKRGGVGVPCTEEAEADMVAIC